MEYPTKLIEEAVNAISRLPGVGRKSALRMVLHLLRAPEEEARSLADAVGRVRQLTTYCTVCHHISEAAICNICANPRRDEGLLCVVESSRDVMAIENTGSYQGRYHVLGGVLSPMEGIGPGELNLETLFARTQSDDDGAAEGSAIREIILALGATMEGDTTAFYIQKRLASKPIKISTIARGIPVGGELEYADEVTLGRSIAQRLAL